MEKVRNALCLYTFGSVVYSIIEILFIGHTHWTMVIAGGCVFLLLFKTSTVIQHRYYTTQIIIFTVLITICELILGLFLNKLLKFGIWDYSNRPFNLFGQINLFNTMLWMLLSIPSVMICKFIRERIIKS